MRFDSPKDRLLICRETDITCTGGVVFIGDGHTGKTHTALNLAQYRKGHFYNTTDCANLSKSVNMEFDYFILYSNIEKYKVTISSQLFIMPGQKGRAEIGEGLAFEDAADLYFHVAPIKVVLALILTFDLSDIKTFLELEYWLGRALERDMVQPYTSIIILGTHLDQEEDIMVTDENMQVAKDFVRDMISQKIGLIIDGKLRYDLLK